MKPTIHVAVQYSGHKLTCNVSQRCLFIEILSYGSVWDFRKSQLVSHSFSFGSFLLESFMIKAITVC